MQRSIPRWEKQHGAERGASAGERPGYQIHSSLRSGAGIVCLLAGLLEFHAASTAPLPWNWLQVTLGAVFPNPQSVVRGTILLVLGGALYAWGVGEAVRAPDSLEERPHPEGAREGHRKVSVVVPALALYAASIGLILTGSTGYIAGLVLLAALVASAVVVALYFPPRVHLFSRFELLYLSLAAIAAGVLYLHDAQSWFFAWVGDEYAFFDFARAIAQGLHVNIFQQAGVYGTHPVMDSVFQAGTIRLLGSSALGWRASCALATAATAFPLYLFARLLYSRLAGVLAVSIYLPAHVLLAYAHIGYNEPDALFPLIAALALLMVGLQYRAPLYLFLAGLFAGAGWYTISTARVAIILVLLGVLLYRRQAARDAAHDIGLILAGFVLVLLPFALVNGTGMLTALADQGRLGIPGLPPLGVRLSQNGVRSLFAFVYSAEVDNHYVTGALFDSVSAFFLLLGMAALLAWRSVGSVFLLLCFWLLVAVNGPTYYALHLNTTRMYIVVPIAAVVAAVGAASLIDQGKKLLRFGPLSRVWSNAAALAIISAVVAANLYTFYGLTPTRLPSTPQTLEMQVIQSHPEATVVETGQLTEAPWPDALQAYGVESRVLRYGSLAAEVAQARQRGRAIIVLSLVPLETSGLHGSQAIIWDPGRQTHIFAFFVRA